MYILVVYYNISKFDELLLIKNNYKYFELFYLDSIKTSVYNFLKKFLSKYLKIDIYNLLNNV